MVDVAEKQVTRRRAVAEATLRMRLDVVAALTSASPKGDAVTTAQLAGIGAAKRTAELIPLCHPIPLEHVAVDVDPDPSSGSVVVRATVTAHARTGVEMEALTAASVAALTVYDMAKSLQRDISIERVVLLEKSGGRSGTFLRGDGDGDGDGDAADTAPNVAPETTAEAAVVTVSDRSAAGDRADASGPALIERLRAAGFSTGDAPQLVGDDEPALVSLLCGLVERGHRLVVTTGGTGLGPRDVTPDATRAVIDYEVPGITERMRAAGHASALLASHARAIAGVR